MNRTLFAYALLAAPLLLALSQAYALECEKDSISIRADAGNYAYGEITCTSYSELFADYEGNMSGDISVFVEGDGNKYRVDLLADATYSKSGAHKGIINLMNDDGEELEIPTRVRIGEGSDEEITLSKYGLSFEMDKTGVISCYNVSVRNTGNAELTDLEAEYGNPELATMAYSNKSWIYISDISEEEFSAGDEKALEICANTNRIRGTELPDQEAIIAVIARGANSGTISEEITVTLRTDLDTAWQKNYEELLDQHKALEQNYSKMRAYKELWEERYVNGSGTLYTYSALSKAYRELKIGYSALEKKVNASNYSQYESLDNQLSVLGARYKALEANYSSLKAKEANMSGKAEASALENESIALKAELEELKPTIEELRAQLEEKDAILAALQAKQKKNETSSAKTGSSKGSFDGYIPFIPIIVISFAAIIAIVAITNRRNRHRAIKKEAELIVSTDKKKKEEADKEDGSREEEQRQKEQQKEALRQLIMQKLAEKAAEKKSG